MGENLQQRKARTYTSLFGAAPLVLGAPEQCSPPAATTVPGRIVRTSATGDFISRRFEFGSASNLLDDLQHLTESVYQLFNFSHNIKCQIFNDIELIFIMTQSYNPASASSLCPPGFRPIVLSPACHFLRGTLPGFSL